MEYGTWVVLIGSAASIGFVHTVIGPDHYLPFVVLARARQWSMSRTLLVTLGCGIGQELSSVLIGAIGVVAGIAVGRLEGVEGVRGEVASWLLIGFGLAYGVWGLRRAMLGKPHVHSHVHENGSIHTHPHTHSGSHGHVHEDKGQVTPWVLFIIFVLGPCEPLIPLLMYPAATHHWGAVLGVTAVFGTVTVLTMLVIVALLARGLFMIRTGGLERYSHALAGGIIALSGLAIKFLGL
ncbi:MAG: sulfite exporter TauE/SafE family protein [candidate division KSB1 bacterium]|nr:sulfite exporter TauE/SafE family protein [candidate division KSB1 bacterium]